MSYRLRTTPLIGALAVAVLIGTVSGAPVRTVALRGQHAPGTPSGVNFVGFFATYLDAAGRTAVNGVDSTNQHGIWSEGSGSLKLVAREGSQAPGTPDGVVYGGFSLGDLTLNATGQTAFRTILVGNGVDKTNDRGIWSEGSGNLELVARTGSQAPGTPDGVNYYSLGGPLLNAAGQTAFSGTLTGSGVVLSNSSGIWSEGSGNLELVARAGSHAPGTPDGVNYRSVLSTLLLNTAGETAFHARLAGSGVDETNDSGVWVGHAGNLRLVVRSGNPAPGTPSGVNYLSIDSRIGLNAAGQTAFIAYLAGSRVDSTNSSGIWSEGSGSLKLVAREGSQAPGTPDGVNYEGFESLVLNAAGQTAFGAYLTGSGVNQTNNFGIWSESFGNLRLVARTGDHAPGTPSGVNFSDFDRSSLQLPVFNAAGQSAFLWSLTGSGVDETNNKGIWATDLTGELQLIVRKGDVLEVAPSDFRTISGLSFMDYAEGNTGNGDGHSTSFNDRGQLAFIASFTDRPTGVLVTNKVAIPETSTLVLAGFATLEVISLARRRKCSPALFVCGH